MSVFTPETPLGQAVQELLLKYPTGQTPAQLRRLLRREKGLHVNEDNLRELLRNRLFVGLSDGRYVLYGNTGQIVVSEADREAPSEDENSGDPWAQPLLVNLPQARQSYVIFDLETTGTNPAADQIIQIAALKVLNGRPTAMRNWYVNPGNVEIPYSLKVILGLADNPVIGQAIAGAPSIQEILPHFLEFIEGYPLVAHNARFDGRFINASLPDKTLRNPIVDNLELAVLLLPNLESHRLSNVAEAIGLPVDQLQAEWAALRLDSNISDHIISGETLHNAVTDVYLLHRVYQRLLEILLEPGPVNALLQTLLPEIFETGVAFTGLDEQHLAPLRSQCNWMMSSAHPLSPQTTPSADRILIDYLAARNYQPRQGQLEMQSLLTEAMSNDQFAMIEAPTGTGKTLAYLSAAIHYALVEGQRVVLSTAYRNLQDQLLAEITDLQQKGTIAFRSQLLKGIGNYFCWSQIARYLEEGDPRREKTSRVLTLAERFVLAYVILWLPGSEYGTADEPGFSYWLLETIPIARSVTHQLRASAACHPGFQSACASCPMPTAYNNAQQADIVVLNHALWLTDSQRLPPFATLVLDEAHTLEDVATNALTQEVSSETLGNLLHRLYNPRTERGLLVRIRAGTNHPEALTAAQGAIAAARRVGELVRDFGPYLVQFIRRCTGRVDPRFGASYRLEASPWKIHGPRWQRIDDAHRQLFGLQLQDLLQGLARLRAAVAEATDLSYQAAVIRELNDLVDNLTKQRQLAYDLIKVDDLKLVYWVAVGPPLNPEAEERDPQPEWWAFKAAPIDVGEALQPYYNKLTSASFVSATLSLGNMDFSYFIDRLGLSGRLDSHYVRRLPPALPYDRNVFLGLVDYLTYAPLTHTMNSFKEELARELSVLLRFTDGRALGLFTARERMEYVAAKLEPELAQWGIALLVQSPEASRRRLLDTFKERQESVLFGLRSFWEGVDAPGETLSFVLMEKLPFPLLIEPVHRARGEYLAQQGKSEFDDYMLPLMFLQFKQGFGRLMRHESDRGAVILFDRRIHRKYYKADLLASLPGHLPRDEEAERSRRRFYEVLAHVLPDLIDLETKPDILSGLVEDILLDLEVTLEQYALPDIIADDEYEQWHPTVLTAMQTLFGHDDFRLIDGMAAQEQVIRHVLAGKDVLGVLPTGAGKSLTFQLPALLRQGVTLVFSPLIALMRDQVAALNERGIEVVGAIYSGQSASERDDVLERMRRSRARLVYISPERLRDPQLLAALGDTKVVQVVVDEAHCVYMWGPSFRPDFLYLPRLFDLLGYRPPLAALTATATPAMQTAIIETLTLRQPARIIAPIDRPELQFIVYNAASKYGPIRSQNGRFKQLLRILQAADRERPPILIYVATTVEADQLARHLRLAGYDARAYHGKMEAADRASVQEMFMDDHINIVVCTKAFGMGIDKPNIRYVIHYHLPGDLESYFQEAGRAGRDRETAYCVLLYHKRDIGTQTYFIDNSTPDETTINQVLQYLSNLPGNTLYLDPDELQERLGMEDVQVRVALHHLESQGYLARSADFTLTGTLTFQVAPEEALVAWQADAVPDADLLARLLRYARWPAYRRLEVRVLSLAEFLGVSPVKIDQLLLQLALRGEVVYRPWQRGFVLEKGQKMETGAVVPAGALAAEQHRREMHRKLEEMINYAENNTTCRRSILLRYFGQDAPDACQGCDVCRPERKWPWSEISIRDFATPDAYVDPAFVFLETVKWNLDRARKYGAPYGTGTLLAILKGDRYMATRHEDDPHLKQWRLGQLRSCPHWGVLSVLPARERVMQATLDRLLTEEYLEIAQQVWDSGQYEYLNLTDKGLHQLTSGRLLQWMF